MACSGRLATAQQFAEFWCDPSPPLTPDEQATIERALDMASADVYSAMSASGQCDCTLAGWATNYLAKLAIIDGAVLQYCPCRRVLASVEDKRMWLDWVSNELLAIRKGDLAVCDGATGNDFPSIAIAEMALTSFNAARILRNRYLRSL